MQRERALLALRVAARTALLLVAVLLWGTVATVVHLDRPAAALFAVALAGVGGWIATALPLLVDWHSTGDPVRQARRVESLRPELRGRLLTAVSHGEGASGGESEALLGLVVRRAVAALQGLGPAEVHPSRPALKWAGLAAAAWLVGVVAVAVVGPTDVARFWFVSNNAHAEADNVALSVVEDLARVGDLVVKYTYPDYTGLPPKVVPNGTGDVAGPPGTTVEVTARAADPMQAGGLVAYEERLEATVGEDGRTLTGSFPIGKEEGTYHLLVYRGAEPERSRDFAVTPEQDLPPDVMLDTPQEVIEVALDQPFPIAWQARDDFGVRKVGIALDGKETERVLERPDRRRAELGGRVTLYPTDLGLAPGARVRLSVVAWDNDTVSGSKRGESPSVEVVVLGANGIQAREGERRAELMAHMIPILSRFLTDVWPPGSKGSAQGTAGDVSRWGEEVASRYQPLSETVERLWSGMNTESQDRAIVQSVLDSGRKLVRYTQTSFEPASVEVPRDEAYQMVGELKDSATVALEEAILAFHELLRNSALREIVDQSEQLESAADQLEAALAEPNPDMQELMSKLDQLERMLEQLAEATAQLEESGLREFLNTRDNEAKNLMEEIRKAMAEGRTEDARKMMERLADLTREMSQGIKDEMERRSEQSDQSQEQANELKKQLEALEQEQRQLQTEVQALRKEDKDASNEMAELWAELERRAAEHEKSAEAYQQGLAENDRAFFERERSAGGVEEAVALKGAVAARDANGARTAVGDAQISWMGAGQALEVQAGPTGRPTAGPGRRELGTLMTQLEQIEKLLDQLEQAERSVDPKTLEKSRELEGKQRDLDNRLKQAGEQAEAMDKGSSVRPQGMKEAIEDASGRMQQAAEDLGQGQPMQAEGSQGVAAQRIRDAIDSLEKAQRQQQQQQQEMQGKPGEEGKQGEDDKPDGNQQQSRSEFDIPGREEFRTPEEYRRALLEGMEGEVPEEYRSMKQRYFEELVHQ